MISGKKMRLWRLFVESPGVLLLFWSWQVCLCLDMVFIIFENTPECVVNKFQSLSAPSELNKALSCDMGDGM